MLGRHKARELGKGEEVRGKAARLLGSQSECERVTPSPFGRCVVCVRACAPNGFRSDVFTKQLQQPCY